MADASTPLCPIDGCGAELPEPSGTDSTVHSTEPEWLQRMNCPTCGSLLQRGVDGSGDWKPAVRRGEEA